MNNNIVTLTDSYKIAHSKQYPPGTESIYSYFESRVGAKFPETVFFGLQYILKEHLEGAVVVDCDVDRAEEIAAKHLGPGIFNRKLWDYIVKYHGGRLPVRIKAVPEGLAVPTDNVLMTVENIDKECFWLTNFLETLLVQVWYPSTVASLSRAAYKMLRGHLVKSGTPENIEFMLHDFGVRGSTGMEAAALGGLAHLIHFRGTDNIPALVLVQDYYHCDMAGFSVPASEHSTITSHGQENELETYRRYFQEVYPKGIAACVTDSWDVYKAAEMWAGPLKDMIMARDGKAVFRPDSGEPREVDPKCINILGKGFGFTENPKGYKVLPTHRVGVIQGDGCDLPMMDEVLDVIEDQYQQSSDNLIYGMGGALLQKLNRDTQRFAFKCAEKRVNGISSGVSKNPITDSRKKSKEGRLCLIQDSSGNFKTMPQNGSSGIDMLEEVYELGEIKRDFTLDTVRGYAQKGL